MPKLGAAIRRTILNIELSCFPRCVPELLLSHLPKFIECYLCIQMLPSKNVCWPHFNLATLYSYFIQHNRDGHETRKLEIDTTPRSSTPETGTLALPAEGRPRRDVVTSPDVTETLKYTL